MTLWNGFRLTPTGALHDPVESVAVVADLHLGYAWARYTDAIPRDDGAIIRDRLLAVVGDTRAKTLVIAGDVIDARMPRAARAIIRDVLAAVETEAEVVLVRGNHDTHLADVADRDVHDSFRAGRAWIVHGDRLLDRDGRAFLKESADHILVSGHEHPALIFRDHAGNRFKQPAFLASTTHQRIVLPALSPFASGVDPRRTWGFAGAAHPRVDPLSFDAFVPSEEAVLPFGCVKDLASRLSAAGSTQR